MAMHQKDYKSEKKNYEKCFKYMNKEHIVDLIYQDYVTCLLNNRDTAKAIIAESDFLAKGYIRIVNQNRLLKIFGKKYGNELIQMFPKIKREYENMPDKKNRLAIAKLEESDQEVRRQKNNMPIEEFNKLLDYTDSMNHFQFYHLVKYENASPYCFLINHIYGKNIKYFEFTSRLLFECFCGIK